MGLMATLAAAQAGGPSSGGLARLFAAARAGNARAVAVLAGRPGGNATEVDGRGFGLLSHVLQGWQGRMESFPRPGWNATGHADLLHTILRDGLQGSSGAALSEPGCPVVDAVHLRLLTAARDIASVMSPARLASCVTQPNAWGQTALHAAASAKATGLTRLLLRLKRGESASSPALASALDLDIAGALADAGRPGALGFAAIASSVGHLDLEWLLAAAAAAGVDVPRWNAMADRLGRTASDIACAEGRLGAAAALLRSARNATTAPEAQGRSCVAAAAVAGFCPERARREACEAAGLTCSPQEAPRNNDGPDDGHAAAGGEAPGAGDGPALEGAVRGAGASAEDVMALVPPSCASAVVCPGSRGWAGANASLARSVAAAIARAGTGRAPWVLAREDWDEGGVEAAARACLFGAGAPCLLRGKGLLGDGPPARRVARRGKADPSGPPAVGRPLVARRALASRGKRLRVSVSELPYGRTYGAAVTGEATLSDFLLNRMGPGADTGSGAHPLYAFQALRPGAPASLTPLPRLPASLMDHIVELIVGPAGSGSMPHFHGPALNALVAGAKLWLVTQPSCALFATVHAVPWLLESSVRGPECVPWALLQRAGDVVTVPRHFGHVVVNLQDSVAVAFEQP